VLAQDPIRLAVKPRLVTELRRRGPVEGGQKRVEQRDVFLPGGRELEQHGAEPFAEDRDAIGEDPGQAHTVEPLG